VALDERSEQERTERPTGRRREEARRRGQVPRSADLSGALGLLGTLGVYSLFGGAVVAHAVEVFRRGLGPGAPRELTVDGAIGLLAGASVTMAHLAWPLVLLPGVIGACAQAVQTRGALATGALTLDWSRLSPIRGLQRVVSARGAVELVKATAKLVVVGGVAFLVLRRGWPKLVTAGAGGGAAGPGLLAQVVTDLWLWVAVAYLGLASLDYGYQWWRHERSLRMTKQELRDETKQTEGDPLLRGRVRVLHRQMAARRMMAEVKRADAVVRNPTHVAVALRYERDRMRAPKVVAKGARLLARRIIEVAGEHRVPVIENPPLARAIFKSVPLGHEIPPALYRAVAEVLAFVYSLRGPGRQAGP
jgi:flagellar biosynthetic protein FlhB